MRIVCQGLGIGQQQELVVRFLQVQPVAQGSDIVAEVQLSRSAVTGENDGALSGHVKSSC